MGKKKARYSQSVHTTQRDLEIIRFLGKYGCANASQIHASFFEGRTLGRAKNRLDELVKGGFLHSSLTDARGKTERIYWIERKGSMQFEEDVRAIFEKGRPPEKEIAHLLKTVDVMQRLERNHTISEFMHEHKLKSLKAKEAFGIGGGDMQIGDALISIAKSGSRLSAGTYMIEIDGDYYGKKAAHKVKSLGACGMSVLFVCFSTSRYEYMKPRAELASNIMLMHIDSL